MGGIEPMSKLDAAFKVQRRVRGPWRRYLDALAPFRSDLYRYCWRLTGNAWDGEDLVQDTLIRVFSMLGKIDVQLDNPRSYLIRTATNLLPPDIEIVRIVDIAGLDTQADGGTHVASTAMIGRMDVVKMESKGRGFRRLRVRIT